MPFRYALFEEALPIMRNGEVVALWVDLDKEFRDMHVSRLLFCLRGRQFYTSLNNGKEWFPSPMTRYILSQWWDVEPVNFHAFNQPTSEAKL